jgi:hypothetical protein
VSEEELQLLITLDDPLELPEEDFFDHLHGERVTFCQGDWACTLSTLRGRPNNVEVCTVTHSKNGEIVEQKVFYDFRGLQQ